MSKHSSRTVRRAPVLLVVAGALLVGGLVDRVSGPRPSAAVTAQVVQAVPVAAPPGAYSSSWFCAGASTASGIDITGQVVVANDGPGSVTGRVTVVGADPTGGGGSPPGKGAPSGGTAPRAAVQAIHVGPYSSVSVPETLQGAAWSGAIVDVDGGSVGVSQVVDGPLGRSTSPCATSGSQRWYLPSGQTRINAAETVLLLNPYPTDSIVDLSFTTNQGLESPQEFQGLDVPPGGLLAVPLGSHLRRRSHIATTVSARTGDVVAWESEVVTPPAKGSVLVGTPAANAPLADPAFPVPGVTVTLGAPSAGTAWVWPDGLAGGGIDERYVIYNPGPKTADVRLSVDLRHGSAEPFELSVGPYQVVQQVTEREARIPAGIPYTATLVSTNGVPVVAARTVTAQNATVGSGTRNGIAQMLGERLSAPDWLVPYTAAGAHHEVAFIVQNPGAAPVKVSVQGLPAKPVGSPGVYTVSIPSGGRAEVVLPKGANGPAEVNATGPVYVQTDIYGTAGTNGYSTTTAIPLS